MKAYFNDYERFVVPWLQGLFPDATVDGRSIREVLPEEVVDYDRVHLFAGIGGWEYALRLAGWPDEWPVWTGSCPCQPFSTAGKRKGTTDERHLWPEFLRLIGQCRPPVVFGEQVASKDGRLWLAGVRADLEALGYGVGAADLCAAGIAAPHIRQRLYWVAYAPSIRRFEWWARATSPVQGQRAERSGEHPQPGDDGELPRGLEGLRGAGGLGYTVVTGLEGHAGDGQDGDESGRVPADAARSARQAGGSGFWDEFDIAYCDDGKARRLEPGSFPLAHGVPARVGKLRAYGNAIVPPLAAEFVRSFMEAVGL